MADLDIVKLNDVIELLSTLDTSRLREMLSAGRLNPGLIAKGCDANCDCKGGYCGCNASVTAAERFGAVSFPEYLQMREARMQELRQELARLETPEQFRK